MRGLFLEKFKSLRFLCIFSIIAMVLAILVMYDMLTFEVIIPLSVIALTIWISLMFAIILYYYNKREK
jgi:fucose permease